MQLPAVVLFVIIGILPNKLFVTLKPLFALRYPHDMRHIYQTCVGKMPQDEPCADILASRATPSTPVRTQ